MSAELTKITVLDVRQMKSRGQKLAMLTAYDYPTTRLIDPYVHMILVGDSVGTNVLGYSSEIPVTLDVMVHHTQAVTRAAKRALVVADMPFGTYLTVADGLRSMARLIQAGGADAVKLEGLHLELIEQAVANGMPVMGHLGLLPQSVHQLGGLRVQAKSPTELERLVQQAKQLEDAGAFAVVLECVPREVALAVTQAVSIPTIGIGAGPDCDGQVLVLHDMLGINERLHKHAKRYADLGHIVTQAVASYVQDVEEGRFPTDAHSFHMPKPDAR